MSSIHHRTKRVSGWLRELLEEQTPEGMPKNKAIAKRLVDIALDPKLSSKDFLTVAEMIMDRLEGKAVQTNVNADLPTNPFDGIPTAKIEALKQKLAEMGESK